LEFDIYECSMSKPGEVMTGTDTYTNFNDLQSVFTYGFAQENVINDEGVVGEVAINVNARGFSPFDSTYALSKFGIKIWKKTKYTILNGDTVTYQVRDPKRRVIDRKSLATGGGFNKPGWTRIIFFVYKLVPGLSVGNTVGKYIQAADIGITRKYTYKIQGVNDDRSILFNQT